MKKIHKSDIEEFIALPDSEKDRIFAEIEAETPEERLAKSRPLNARERAQWAKFKKRAAQHVGSSGVRTVSITVKAALLERADQYAKRHKLNRSELFTQGLERLIKTV